jgi:hypothetical protein
MADKDVSASKAARPSGSSQSPLSTRRGNAEPLEFESMTKEEISGGFNDPPDRPSNAPKKSLDSD